MSDPSLGRDLAFRKIQTAYQDFYQKLKHLENSLCHTGVRSRECGPLRARKRSIAVSHFQLDQYSHMADLGSGDGIVVAIASLFTQATGYEVDEWLYEKSIELWDILKFSKATFLQADFLRADLSGHDLLFLYPDKPFYELEERLHNTWRGRLLVNGPHFPPRQLKKVAESPPSIGRFVLYESP